MTRRKPAEKPLNYILLNKEACQKTLQYIADHGGHVSASEAREFVRPLVPTDEYRNNILNALYVCACLDRLGTGKDRVYVMTMHGKDLLDSFKG